MLIGTVKYIIITLENGQHSVRNRALLRTVKGKIFIDSIQTETLKILLRDSEEIDSNEKFAIAISTLEKIELSEEITIRIGDAILEATKVSQFELEVKSILKGGFVKSGNEVLVVKF